MSKAYLLVYSDELGSRAEVKSIVDSIDEITFWKFDMPNCFYILSSATSKTIATMIRTKSGVNGKFLLSEIPDNSFGWLSSETWKIIQEKKPIYVSDE